jgi:short-subunit dehydrogenase
MNNPPTILITGATDGIGQRVALELARQEANLIITARSEIKADTTLAAIKTTAPTVSVDVYYADFSDLSAVTAIGEKNSGAAFSCRCTY